MKRYAMVTRHTPTAEQVALAAGQGIELVPVGDRDAFTIDPAEFRGQFDGAVVVHPAAALRLIHSLPVAVFENGNRAADGQAPGAFVARALHIWVPQNRH